MIEQEQLEKLGIRVRIAHFTGDSSYPTEYTLTHGNLRAVGPTLDLALVEFVEKLLQSDPVTSYRAIETAIQALSGAILALRTELLFVKALVAGKDGESDS